MASQSSRTNKPYRISTSKFRDGDFKTTPHELDDTAVRKSISLGDMCGLTKLGVQMVRLPPHSKSSTLHWHSTDDEWLYVLESGEAGAKLVTLPDGETQTKEETIRKGDFIGFRAASGLAHVVTTGDEEVVFLCCGKREPMDVVTYPLKGKKLLIDREGGPRWYAEVANIEYQAQVEDLEK
ncbi:hypothetical protein BC835DRAFT_258383 [Cytidiella melzeri]|nr:hypothetical protein BC835DRAFT_258383 [Cytidiella melzeri]